MPLQHATPTAAQAAPNAAPPRTPETAIGAAIIAASCGIPCGPYWPGGAFASGYDCATTDLDAIEAMDWQGARGCGSPLDMGGWLVVDVDDRAKLPLVLDLFEVETIEDLAALTFVTESERGPHVWVRRPDCLIGNRAPWVYDPERPDEALTKGVDVVCGLGKVWGPRKRWLSTPERIMECPPKLLAAIEAMVKAHKDRKRAESLRAIENAARQDEDWQRYKATHANAAERGEAYANAALDGIAADAGRLPEGRRNVDGNSANFRAGTYAGAEWNGITESVATAAMVKAHNVNGLGAEMKPAQLERWVRSGIRAGMRHPAAPPADRDDWQPSQAQAVGSEVKPLSAAQVAELKRRIAGARELALASGAQGQAISTRARLGVAVCHAMIEQGINVTTFGNVSLAEAVGCAPATASRHRQGVADAFGLEVTIGGLDDTGKATATVWKLPDGNIRNFAQRRNPSSCETTGDGWKASVYKVAENAQPAARGLRSRPSGIEQRVDGDVVFDGSALPKLSATGLDVAWHLDDQGTAHPAGLAEAVGCAESTARRACEILAEFGIAKREYERTGARGRPRAVYRWIGWPADLLAKLRELGEWAWHRIMERVEEFRAGISEARQVAAETGVSFRAAWAVTRQKHAKGREGRHAKQSRTDQRSREGLISKARNVGQALIRAAGGIGVRAEAEAMRARQDREQRARVGPPRIVIDLPEAYDENDGDGWRKPIAAFKAGEPLTMPTPAVDSEPLPVGW